MQSAIAAKVENKIALSLQDIPYIARGCGASYENAIRSLQALFAAESEPERHEAYRKLLSEHQRAEPYESLPDEARPSLARLQDLCESSTVSSDSELLLPIRKLLEEYQTMKRDHLAMKRRNLVSFVIAIVSFLVGVAGFAQSFNGLSEGDVAKAVKTALETEKH